MESGNLYCVFDIKAERYFPPFVRVNDAVADRFFLQLLVNPESELAKNPDEYRLYRVGKFDAVDGHCEALGNANYVCVNQGWTPPGRPADVALAEEESFRKFSTWIASRGLELGRDGKIRQLDKGGVS